MKGAAGRTAHEVDADFKLFVTRPWHEIILESAPKL